MDGQKFIMWTCVTVGGGIGGYLPVILWQADPLGGWSILGGLVGGLAGIWLWYRYLR